MACSCTNGVEIDENGGQHACVVCVPVDVWPVVEAHRNRRSEFPESARKTTRRSG